MDISVCLHLHHDVYGDNQGAIAIVEIQWIDLDLNTLMWNISMMLSEREE